MKSKKIKYLSFPVYFWSVAVIAAAGLADSLYLSFSHYRAHNDILYTSFCAVSGSFNCDTVSQSIYSIFLGLPVPVWGIVGYTFFLLLLSFAGKKQAGQGRVWSLLVLTALIFSVYSIILAYISKYHIKTYCIMCMVSYAINFFLLYCGWIVTRRFCQKGFFSGIKKDLFFLWEKRKRCVYLFTPLLICMVCLLFFFPKYWKFDLPSLSSEIPTGVNEQGCPWIGAEDPELVITEFTDYMCFQCRKSHVYLRKIVEKNSDKIRLVHRHFPLDPAFNPIVTTFFHQGSGKLAVAAAYAAYEGKFWEMNDLLYEIPRGIKELDMKRLAKKSGVNFKDLVRAQHMRGPEYKVKYDIAKGIELGIKGTPAYVINGKVYQGRIPVDVIRNALE